MQRRQPVLGLELPRHDRRRHSPCRRLRVGSLPERIRGIGLLPKHCRRVRLVKAGFVRLDRRRKAGILLMHDLGVDLLLDRVKDVLRLHVLCVWEEFVRRLEGSRCCGIARALTIGSLRDLAGRHGSLSLLEGRSRRFEGCCRLGRVEIRLVRDVNGWVIFKASGRLGQRQNVRGPRRRRRKQQGEFEPKGRTNTQLTVDTHSTTHQLDDLHAKSQSKTSPLAALSTTDFGLDIGREEGTTLGILGAETDSSILDFDTDDRLVVATPYEFFLVRSERARIVTIERLLGGDRIVIGGGIPLEGSKFREAWPEQFRRYSDSTYKDLKISTRSASMYTTGLLTRRREFGGVRHEVAHDLTICRADLSGIRWRDRRLDVLTGFASRR